MNPLDILKLTPKTNCGKCGLPTCLAFSAAVVKTGEDLRKCPFIDTGKIPLALAGAVGKREPVREHDLALIEHLKSKIADLNFSAIAGPLGATCPTGRPDTLVFSYLGDTVHVAKKEGILLEGKTPVDPRDQILLYNYVYSGGGRPPTGSWVGMESLPNSISKVKTLATYCQEPLARLFSGRRPEEIIALLESLGGRIDPGSTATVGMVLPVLPMVPQYLLFWEAEPADGFAAAVKVLFDRYIMDFLDLESLVFTAERLADRVVERNTLFHEFDAM